MGDVADSVLAGACCASCGSYFVREHGYPVLCTWCWRRPRLTDDERERTPYQLATEKEMRPV